MISFRVRRRLELRRSNAARPHRNRRHDPTDARTEAEQGLMDYEEMWEDFPAKPTTE